MDQANRLVVAAHIKAIADSADTFDAARADAIDRLLQNLEAPKVVLKLGAVTESESQEGHAAGVGDVEIPGERRRRSLSVGERELRCGAYVVTRCGPQAYEIRHVMEVDAESEAGELMQLARLNGRWEARLNQPRRLVLGFLVVQFGNRFVPWKIGI
ncbi:hypothetical protein ACFOGJ_08225 [Marinibaculum pumilum]|uniref:Uncharacterized protein n=1 Tax=Marinibaculum pumilum TaxID=1766165 RepID=A0ABV7KYH4_9PROT